MSTMFRFRGENKIIPSVSCSKMIDISGRNIWSLAVNQTEDLIATGGGDGSVRLWALASPNQDSRSTVREASLPSSDNTAPDKTGSQKNKKEDYPRFVTLLDQSSLIVMTNEGCLYKYSWLPEKNTNGRQDPHTSLNQGDQWTLLLKDTNYSSYSVLALSPCHKIIAFGNLKGKIKLQDTAYNQPCMELEAYSGKVHNLLWSCQHSPQHLFSCGPDGQITWWNIRYNDGEPLLEVTPVCLFVLPPSKQRWASAIEIFSNGKESWTTESVVVVCGDRKGSLHLFDPKDADPEKPITPAHSLPLIHGKAGVSHLCVHDNTMYSAGRDGVYRQLRVHSKTLQVVDTKKVFKGFDWVERLIFTNNGDLLIAGFHAAYFVLWSVRRNELLWRMKCGGAHRVWDLALQQSDVTITAAVLSFIKDSTIYTHKISFPSEVKTSVLKPAFHGREATCICYIDSLVGQKDEISDVFATGSEDTNIKLMISNRSTGVTLPVFTAHGHISSVRALSVTKRPLTQLQPSAINGKTQGHLLFSGGGRASLKCWRVDVSVINLNSDGRHGDKMTSSPMVFLAEYSFHFSNHRRRRKKRDLQSLSEIRFMSLTSLSAAGLIDQSTSDQLIDSCQSLYFVMAGCSDGFVRIFAFDEQQNKFSLLAQSQYLKRCVLTVSHVTDFLASGKPLVMLFAGDTAGRISCWDVTALLLNHIKECSVSTCEVSEHEYRNDIAVEKISVWDGKLATKARENRLFDASVSTRKGDTAPESVDTCHAKENATANSHPVNILSNTFCKGRVTEDCDGKGNVTNFELNNKRTESSKFADIQLSTENKDPLNFVQAGLGNLNHAKERTAVTYEMPDQSRTQSDFSCLPLVGIFLDRPTHVFGAHQSGVNAISITKTQVPGQYLLVSGGDDSALYAAQFNLMFDSTDVTKVHVTCEVSEASAHTSSVTGVKTLENGLVISSSVDQRLALWEVVRKDQEPSSSFAFSQLAVEMVDVADVQDLEILGERNDCLVAAVCGVGLQMFCLVGRS